MKRYAVVTLIIIPEGLKNNLFVVKDKSLSGTVVWEIFDSKNISWVLATHEKILHENLLPQLIHEI